VKSYGGSNRSLLRKWKWKERIVFEKTKMDELLKRKEDKIQIERASLKMQQQKEANEATRLKKYSDALRGGGQSPDRQMTLKRSWHFSEMSSVCSRTSKYLKHCKRYSQTVFD